MAAAAGIDGAASWIAISWLKATWGRSDGRGLVRVCILVTVQTSLYATHLAGELRERKTVLSKSAGTRAYAIIKEGILSGRFAPNERLKEDELTTMCEVSRTPVREALRRLGIEGLVKVTPNAGAQVIAPDPAELSEIYQLRGMIEGHAAERAAANVTPADIARLKELAAEMEFAVEIGGGELGPKFTPANAEFHRIILTAAMSPRLSAMAALVIELPLTLRTLNRYSEGDRRRSLRHHRELIDALEMRDGPWAASVMRSHIHAAYRALVRGGAASDDG